MTNLPTKTSTNPLSSLMRKAKLRITLPSRGRYWTPRSLNLPESGELDVFSMTAKDEIMLKNPTTLLAGQNVVDVIQSCVPAIKDAWETPSIDIDAILLAIRIATYGPAINTNVTVNDFEFSYPADLGQLLEVLTQEAEWDNCIVVNDNLKIFVRPLNYKQINKTTVEALETEKIFDIVGNDKLSEEKKVEMFTKSFNKLTRVNLDVVIESISQIVFDSQEVTERKFIQEFIEQCDSEVFNSIKEKLDEYTLRNANKTIRIVTTQEMRNAGAENEMDITVYFDANNFFK